MAKKKNTLVPVRRAPTFHKHLENLIQKPKFSSIYTFTTLLILLVSTFFWSILGAHIHSTNADQLVNSYLFDSSHIFNNGLLPGTHSFLLKWPLFFFIKLLGESKGSYTTVTVAVSLMTVASFAYILHRIERRPFVKGTIFLALASVLLVIPAQPYPGGLLPVNMAMLATRNLEYILYIVCTWGIIRSKRFISTTWVLSVLGLALLIASDRLFLSISLGASLTSCMVYIFRKRHELADLTGRWFISNLAAAIISYLIVIGINFLHLVHISSSGAGPYKLIHNLHQLINSVLGAIFGLFSNFGANPAFNTVKPRQVLGNALGHIFSFGGPILIVNFIILCCCLVAIYHLFMSSLKRIKAKRKTNLKYSDSQNLAILMIWSTIIAFVSFMLTDHNYVVDSRYLAIIVFTSFIALATFTRTKRWEEKKIVFIGIILFGAMCLSVPMVINTYYLERDASITMDSRNLQISRAITNHRVNVLVGDYWRVLPIKQLIDKNTVVMPLSNCTTPRNVLSSTSWQPNLDNNSFAYILSLDKSQTDYPTCSADKVFASYGKPNSSIVIDGNIEHPKELLLFYDHGAHKSSSNKTSASSSIEPILIKNLTHTECNKAGSLIIVAHEDDDLLFMNPDLQKDISAGKCIRTVYITSGDAGSNQLYWLAREQGSEAAYSKMLGKDSIWIQRTLKLGDNQFATVASPRGNSKISLIFMHLPDGNLRGQGFNDTKRESLIKLLQGQIPSIHSIYGNSTYTADSLTLVLSELIKVYRPSDIRTQATFASKQYPDHSDHMSVSKFVEKAYKIYEASNLTNDSAIPIKHYIGYPIHSMPQNVFGTDLINKIAVFLSYAKHDLAVCQSQQSCSTNQAYGYYLKRQYFQ